jgi:hypothetical protein
MGATATTTFAGLLTETFTRDRVFAPFERALAKFHDNTMDFPSEEPLGKGRTFGIRTKDAHSVGAVSEASGTTPSLRQPEVIQANVDAVQVVGAVGWTELMLSAGRGLGSLGPDVLTDHIDMVTRNVNQLLNRLSLGHGTGRMAVVEAGTTTSTTFVCRNPEHVLQLRVNMLIDWFDTDTGGSKQGISETITDIDFDTRTVTIGAARSLTAGWGVYQSLNGTVSTYGVAPFGLRAWADNGGLTSSIAGLTRSSNPGVNANVIQAATGTLLYSEKLMRKAINRAFFACGMEPDEAWTNKGIVSEHINHLVGDRIFTLSPGDNVPRYRIGHNEMEIGFQNGGSFIPYKVDGDMPDREIIFIKKSLFRRHQLRQVNWIGDDSGVDGVAKAMLLQLPASGGGYELSKVAMLLGMVNYGNKMPKSIVAVRTVADEELAGDTVTS